MNKHIIKEYPLDITSLLDNPKDVALSKWIEVDVSSLNIKIEDGQMLGFGKNTDNALLCIDRTVHNNEYLRNDRTSVGILYMPPDVFYVIETGNIDRRRKINVF